MKKSAFWFSVLVSALLPFGMDLNAASLRIMPLGDSITYGAGSQQGGGYRAPLYTLLTNATFTVDFIGTQTGNAGPLTEKEHEGHSGWRISAAGNGLYENIRSWFSSLLDPHVILLHIGTNDTNANDFEHAIDRWDLLIDRIAECHPDTKIIATTLLERNASNYTKIQQYFNPYVEERIAAHVAKGQKVYFLDMNAVVPLSDMPDQLHPNDAGYAKMAAAWFGAITNLIASPDQIEDNRPAPLSVVLNNTTLKTITIRTNMALDRDSATNTAHYATSVGTVQSVALSSDARTLTVTFTQPFATDQFHTFTIQSLTNQAKTKSGGPYDRTFFASIPQGASRYVPEYKDYQLVYSLEIPSNGKYLYNTVPYTIDNHASTIPFDRIAYYLELRRPNENLQYIWVSLDAFTKDAAKIGIPTRASQAFFQQYVTNLKVWSNVETVTPGEKACGNIEFWPTTYTAKNGLPVSGASDDMYDFGDTPTKGDYGSFQIHDADAGKTLFSYSHWTTTETADLGIGPCPNPVAGNVRGADWTFMDNSGEYEIRHLEVYVRPDTTFATSPSVLSAELCHSKRQILITFDTIIEESHFIDSFSLNSEAKILSATLNKLNPRQISLSLNTPISDPTGITLSIQKVRSASPRHTEIAENTTIPLSWKPLPPEITQNVDAALTDGYKLIYTANIPIYGSWNKDVTSRYLFDDASSTEPFDRIGYYLELVKPNLQTQFIWVSMDAFTANPKRAGIPFSSLGRPIQTRVGNLDVQSNLSSISNGTGRSGGFIEFAHRDYGQENALNIPGASSSKFDFGDFIRSSGSYGCMQVHDIESKTTLFAINHWGVDNQRLDIGIGNNSNGEPDWTFMGNTHTYAFRKFHILVRPAAQPAPITAAPERITSRVPDAEAYHLLYEVDIPVKATFNNSSSNALYHVTNREKDLSSGFSRVAYFLELVPTGSTVTQYIWTAFDPFTQEYPKLSVPRSATFQQKIANLDVYSNVDGIQTGTGIQTGNIEFHPYNYSEPNTINIPNASGTKFDFGDHLKYEGSHGCLQIHNYGAQQTLLSICGYNNNSTVSVGIGNRSSGQPDWTFANNAGAYTYRCLSVLVKPDPLAETESAKNIPRRVIAARARDRLCVSYKYPITPAQVDLAAYQFAIDPGVEILSAAASPAESRDVLLTLSAPLQTNSTHTLILSASVAGSETKLTFTTPGAPLVPFLNKWNVPEFVDYLPVNVLPFPTYVGYSARGADYQMDESRFATVPLFDRIAYCLELKGTNGVYQWAYASMDAFTADPSKIGLPTIEREIVFQQYVKNLTIACGGDTNCLQYTGSVDQGNIEFWPGNYGEKNSKGIPDASDSIFDCGDEYYSSGTSAGHGSMQVHNYQKKETIISINAFGNNGDIETQWRKPALGIGNDTSDKHTDWTHNENADEYSIRNLYVFVRPAAESGTSDANGPTFLLQPKDTTILNGKSLELNTYANRAVRYQWRKNGEAIPFAVDPWLELDTTSPESATYDVIAYSAAGEQTISEPATVKVYSNQTLLLIQ